MEIVFLNRLHKDDGQEAEAFAQIWIGEQDGLWSTGWSGDAGEEENEIWYEGGNWSELLCIYRYQLAQKLSAGYRPLLEGVFHEHDESSGRVKGIQQLYCYSELHSNDQLYAELVAWRRSRSARDQRAPYMIAGNRLLRLISTFVPRTHSELLELPGMGDSKLVAYGEEILELTARTEQPRAFPLVWVHEELDPQLFANWSYKQKELKYKLELDQFNQRRCVLQGIADGQGLESLGQSTSLPRRELLDLLEELARDGCNLEPLIMQELTPMPEDEQHAVWSAYEELGDQYLKPVLHKVYGTEQNAEVRNSDRYERLRLIRIRYRRADRPIVACQ